MKQPSPVVVRPATREDLKSFYGVGGSSLPTMVAMVGVVDNEIVGVGGILRAGRRRIAFCDITESGRRYKIAIVRTGRRLLREAAVERRNGRSRVSIHAGLDETQPGAARFLASLGFVPLPGNEGVYRWQA